MKYERIVEGQFIERPNRFVAYVNINGKREKVHVKNTGRCRELLQDNAQVFLSYSDKKERSTAYDLVAVKKGERIGQAMFQKYLVADDDEAQGERTGGFGSTN